MRGKCQHGFTLILLLGLIYISTAIAANTSSTSPAKQKGNPTIFADLARAKQVYGPRTEPLNLRGHVVLLVYWDVNSPESVKIFSELVKLTKKAAKDRKLVILASHMKEDNIKVKAFARSNFANFPVFQQYNCKDAPAPTKTPSAALIDHTGKVVLAGKHPFEAIRGVPALVRANFSPTHPIIGEVKVKHWKRYSEDLCKGKNVEKNLKVLQRAAPKGGEKGEEAKALVAAIQKYLKDKQMELLTFASSYPTEAQAELIAFEPWVRGMKSLQEPIKNRISELSTDGSLVALTEIQMQHGDVNEKLLEGSRSAERGIFKVKEALTDLIEKKRTSPSVRKEAQIMIKALK